MKWSCWKTKRNGKREGRGEERMKREDEKRLVQVKGALSRWR